MRLPGAGGAPEIAASAKEVIIVLRHAAGFVEELAFRTSVGYLDGGDSREKLRYLGGGPTVVITDLGILRPDPKTRELTLQSAPWGERRAGTRGDGLGPESSGRPGHY